VNVTVGRSITANLRAMLDQCTEDGRSIVELLDARLIELALDGDF
jgi:hypothetical protein